MQVSATDQELGPCLEHSAVAEVPTRQPMKFDDPYITADGSLRASVAFTKPTTLWFNTGTLCNITCENCYIKSSPHNDRLVYITADEVETYLDEINENDWPFSEIAFTGGEPFMNPEIIEMLRRALAAEFDVLVLTNAMRPMMRPRVKSGLLRLRESYQAQLVIRISLDHHNEIYHDQMRGRGSFKSTLDGMDWLQKNGFKLACAGRTLWGETDEESRAGYSKLFRKQGYSIDSYDPVETMLFPEIYENVDVPEITVDCWQLLGKHPEDIMCSSSRMVVKRNGAKNTTVVACTLLPFESEFDLGASLDEASCSVQLNHSSCAQFCVLGGASCSRHT